MVVVVEVDVLVVVVVVVIFGAVSRVRVVVDVWGSVVDPVVVFGGGVASSRVKVGAGVRVRGAVFVVVAFRVIESYLVGVNRSVRDGVADGDSLDAVGDGVGVHV